MAVGELTNDELLAIVRQRHSAMTDAIMDLPLFTALVDDAMPYIDLARERRLIAKQE